MKVVFDERRAASPARPVDVVVVVAGHVRREAFGLADEVFEHLAPGGRAAVEFVVGLLAAGWPEAEILRNYPGIAVEDIRAGLAYAHDRLAEERYYRLPA